MILLIATVALAAAGQRQAAFVTLVLWVLTLGLAMWQHRRATDRIRRMAGEVREADLRRRSRSEQGERGT